MIKQEYVKAPDLFSKYIEVVKNTEVLQYKGKVAEIRDIIIESTGPEVRMGEICFIEIPDKGDIAAEVVAISDKRVYIMPYGDVEGIYPGCDVRSTGRLLRVAVGDFLLGKVVDGRGYLMDQGQRLKVGKYYNINAEAPNPLDRERITEPLSVGIRAIDGLITLGKGQRIGIFSGSGVGKSTLLGMIARNTNADVNVIALVGERGREVKDFLEKELGEEGLKRSVMVVATSDKPPLLRMRATYVATTIAEYFRDQGKDVLLMMDSITRFAKAQAEIGLATGEPPARRGYPNSVFTTIPRILERAGRTDKGSITGIYTVLVDADELNEPISDTMRGVLDGHIVLSRNLAERNHYPAVDILASISRLMNDVVSEEHKAIANKMRNLYSIYKQYEDIIILGAYAAGSNPELDEAIKYYSAIDEFLKQGIYEKSDFEETFNRMKYIFEGSATTQRRPLLVR